MQHKVLILDYSTDSSEADAVMQWLPAGLDVQIQYLNRDDGFPRSLFTGGYSHIIHSGSALSINDGNAFIGDALLFIREMSFLGAAQFGICYGHQLICRALSGDTSVRQSPKGLEAGWAEVRFTDEGRALLSLRERETVWQSHFDEVTSIPDGSVLLATNSHSEVQAYYNRKLNILGTQFHPEFDKSTGDQLFRHERVLLTENGYLVEDLLNRGPSFDAGNLFFSFFLTFVPFPETAFDQSL